tara:strand:- start:124 stop:315 length:192 start_codon:yes stop_codon:yes gene_type:complete
MWLWIRHIIEIVVFSFLVILFMSWDFWLTTGIAYLFAFYVISLVFSLISKIFFAIALLREKEK